MQPETRFKIWLAPKLKALNPSWWFKTQQIALRGIPDYIGCVAGRFCALELKKDSTCKPTKLQQFILNAIEMAGGYARCVHPGNVEEVLKDLKRIAKKEYI